jgi:hypothetical protein
MTLAVVADAAASLGRWQQAPGLVHADCGRRRTSLAGQLLDGHQALIVHGAHRTLAKQIL